MKPLIVDYDGTFIKVDSLIESFLNLLFRNPVNALWSLKYINNIPKFKQHILNSNKSGDLFPVNKAVLEFLVEEKKKNRPIYLVSGSNEIFLNNVLNSDNIFTSIYGSSNSLNLVGKNKLNFIQSSISKDFDYIGDSFKDFHIWKASDKAYCVNLNFFKTTLSKLLIKKELIFIGNKISRIALIMKFLRSHQWVKNLLIFVPITLSSIVTLDDTIILPTIYGFIFLCLTASAGYIINDIVDIDSDRMHHTKKNRPIANGDVQLATAFAISSIMIFTSLFMSLKLLGNSFFIGLSTYLMISIFYSLCLKKVAILDIITLGGLFTLRIFLGILIQGNEISFWLLVFSIFFFLSLAALKRFVEVLNIASHNKTSSSNIIPGRGYGANDKDFLFILGVVSGLISIFLLLLFFTSQSGSDSLNYQVFIHTIASIIIMYWLMRMWLYGSRMIMNEDPISFAIKDTTSITLGIIVATLLYYA